MTRTPVASAMLAALVTAMVAIGSAGCGPEKKADNVQAMTQQQATDLVHRHARTLATIVGADPEAKPTRIAPNPCENKATGETAADGRFYIQGNWQLTLPGEQHKQAFSKLREAFVKDGYAISEDVMFNETEGSISAENPTDEVQITVQSTRPPTALAVVILTPCYRPA